MIPISILLVEDEVESADLIKETLDLELEDVGISATWQLLRDALNARKAVRDGGPIDVAIVDLYLGKPREKDGITVVKDVRAKNEQAYILVVTGHPDWSPSFRDDLTGFAINAIDKDELRDSGRWSWSNLAQDIRDHLIHIGRLDAGGVTYDGSDPGIVSVLQRIGRTLSRPGGDREGARALRVLAVRCLGGLVGGTADMNISYLSAGRSGASVCRLDVHGDEVPSQAFVLKFGLDRRALERELIANREAGKVLDQQSLMAMVGAVGSHECGYHAIAARIANRAISLRQWLVYEATIEQARALAEVVLLEQLEPFYREDGRMEVGTEALIKMPPVRRLRARASLLRYADAIGDSRAGAQAGSEELIQRLMRFIELGELDGDFLAHLRRRAVYVQVFGDLHSENVLVQPSIHPRPVLIDASLYDRGHWSLDNSRILVDLLLRVRNPGVESMLWTDMPNSPDGVLRLCPYCETDTGWKLTATDAFMRRAVELLASTTHMAELGVHRDDWHWEWHISLAKELLRQSDYESLTPPRACLALIAAGEHLRIAAEVA